MFLNMTDYISKYYNQSITIDSLSKRVGISRNKCCELFQQFTKNTHLSILEIAQLCGFSSSSYFTTVFKKVSGCSPKYVRME